jgi:hypothetical protein
MLSLQTAQRRFLQFKKGMLAPRRTTYLETKDSYCRLMKRRLNADDGRNEHANWATPANRDVSKQVADKKIADSWLTFFFLAASYFFLRNTSGSGLINQKDATINDEK